MGRAICSLSIEGFEWNRDLASDLTSEEIHELKEFT